MTTKEVADLTKNAPITVRIWAAENGVEYIGEGVRKTYIWKEDDLKRFENRNKVMGRPKTKDSDK